MTLACGAAVRRGICDAIARSRPPGSSRWEQPSGHSFPSKHTTTATLAAAAFAPQDVRLPMAAGALVGATRLYLGVHWPTDVAAGLLTGLGFLYAARAVQSD
jgi:undecaprenyl-diphosphatase